MIRLVQALVQAVGALVGLGIVRVSGLSMVPALEDGDFVVFRRLSGGDSPSPGSMVVVRHRRLGMIIKLLGEEVAPGQFRLHGLSALSMDSQRMGNTARQDVIGQVLLRVGPQGLSRAGRFQEPG